jgi:hypothetical protein
LPKLFCHHKKFYNVDPCLQRKYEEASSKGSPLFSVFVGICGASLSRSVSGFGFGLLDGTFLPPPHRQPVDPGWHWQVGGVMWNLSTWANTAAS